MTNAERETPRPFRSSDQTIAYLPCGSDDLFAILTKPTTEPNGVTVYQLWGIAQAPASGLNEFRTRLTASLAARGFHVLRIDYRGGGESSGEPQVADLRQPPIEEPIVGLRWLHEQGLQRVILIGNCFGALIAMHFAERVADLEGVMFLGPPLRDATRNTIRAELQPLKSVAKQLVRAPVRTLRDPTVRLILGVRLRRLTGMRGRKADAREETVAPVILERLEKLTTRGVPVLFCYGPMDGFKKDWEAASRGPLRQYIERNLVEFKQVAERATPPTIAAQNELVEVLTNWSSSMVNQSVSAT